MQTQTYLFLVDCWPCLELPELLVREGYRVLDLVVSQEGIGTRDEGGREEGVDPVGAEDEDVGPRIG